jgi:hypothetical protein
MKKDEGRKGRNPAPAVQALTRGPHIRMAPNRRAKCPQTRYPDPNPTTLHETGASPNSAQLIASRQCVRRLQRPEDNAGLGLCVGAARCTIRRAPAAHIGDPQPCHLYRCTASVGHPGFVPLPAAVAPTSSASPGLSPSLADGWFGFGVPPVLTGPHRVRNKPEKCAALRPAATLPSPRSSAPTRARPSPV